MNSAKKEGKEREMPYTHIYLILSPIIFILIWILDSSIIQLSIFLNEFIPFIIRLILFILIMIFALSLIYISHHTLFPSHRPPSHLILDGIFRYVRNPMYLGILLIYMALICLSISLISIGLFFLIFFLYNKMVNFEESILEKDFGEEYLNYKQQVPKWIPSPFKRIN